MTAGSFRPSLGFNGPGDADADKRVGGMGWLIGHESSVRGGTPAVDGQANDSWWR